MLKYKMARQKEGLAINIDGRDVSSIRDTMYHVIDYIDTIKFIPRYLGMQPGTAKMTSDIIVQSFSDLFRKSLEVDYSAPRMIEDVTQITNKLVIPRVAEIVMRDTTIEEEKFKDACRVFIPTALLKLNNALTTDLSG